MGYFELTAVSRNILTNTSVDVYANLPSCSEHYGEVWLVQNTTGIYGFRKLAGFYRASLLDWTYLGDNDSDIVAILNSQVCSEDSYVVDSSSVISKSFPITKPLVPTSERVYWNGLGQRSATYSIQDSQLIFNSDVPLTVGDDIWIKYLIRG